MVIVQSEASHETFTKFFFAQRDTKGALRSFCLVRDLGWELDEVFVQSETYDGSFTEFLFNRRPTMGA